MSSIRNRKEFLIFCSIVIPFLITFLFVKKYIKNPFDMALISALILLWPIIGTLSSRQKSIFKIFAIYFLLFGVYIVSLTLNNHMNALIVKGLVIIFIFYLPVKFKILKPRFYFIAFFFILFLFWLSFSIVNIPLILFFFSFFLTLLPIRLIIVNMLLK